MRCYSRSVQRLRRRRREPQSVFASALTSTGSIQESEANLVLAGGRMPPETAYATNQENSKFSGALHIAIGRAEASSTSELAASIDPEEPDRLP